MSIELNKDKRTGWLVSFGVHALLILLFFLINAWSAPDPPLPEYGIEINIGLEEEGSGFEQPAVQPTPPTPEPETESQQQAVEEQEEVIEEPLEQEVVEEVATEELFDSQQEDSPVEAEPIEEPVPENIVEETIPEEKLVEEEVIEEPQPEEKPSEEEITEEPKEEEKQIDTNALYPGATSQGEQEDATGDAGDPKGSVDSRALYAKQGGGSNGPSLDMAGWRWDYIPNPDDQSKENGRIVFEIKVDDNGDIIGVRTLEKTVSPSVEQLYRREVEKLTFSPTSGNSLPAPISTGRITFLIRSK